MIIISSVRDKICSTLLKFWWGLIWRGGVWDEMRECTGVKKDSATTLVSVSSHDFVLLCALADLGACVLFVKLEDLVAVRSEMGSWLSLFRRCLSFFLGHRSVIDFFLLSKGTVHGGLFW